MTLTADQLKTYSEIAKNIAEGLGLLGAGFALYKWIVGRRDRSAQVLLELETRFDSAAVRAGRTLVEENGAYKEIRKLLLAEVVPEEDQLPGSSALRKSKRSEQGSPLQQLDALLRFYVLIYGLRKAKQVADSALSACYRFFLAHYYSPARRELRLYIYHYFPTLREWLRQDRSWYKRHIGRTFFTPEQFGWYPERQLTARPIERALNGRILVITGAGISADSGLQTFRTDDGHWELNDPRTLATREAFRSNPERVWRWYLERRVKARAAQPSTGHMFLAQLAQAANECLIVTQNVDDLHERAGTDPKHLVRLHGDLFVNLCEKCRHTDTNEVPLEPLPVCSVCQAPLRPGVVWYGEDLDRKVEDRINDFLNKGPSDLVLVVGTSATFNYILDWAIRAAGDAGFLVEVNPEQTYLSPAADMRVRRRAAEALPELLGVALARRAKSARAAQKAKAASA